MSETELDPAFPSRVYLRLSPETTVARPALGLTVYIDEPLPWAREGALALLQAFNEFVPPGALRYFTTSMILDWRGLGREGMRAVNEALAIDFLGGRQLRHLFELRVCDDPDAPAYGFRYREVDTSRVSRCGFIEFILPPTHEPADLLQLALLIGHRFPFVSGMGGYMGSWNEAEKPTAFEQMFRWCCRYVGVDIQEPERMAWLARRGLAGTSWINMIGPKLAATCGVDLQLLAARRWSQPDIAVMSLGQGTLIRAGAAPEIGDINRLVFPHGYAEVARALQPLMLEEPPPLSGPFTQDEAGLRWYRRFVEPEGWS